MLGFRNLGSLKVILQLYSSTDIIRRVKRLNKLLLALFLFTSSLFIFPQQSKAQSISTKCSQSTINVAEYVAPRCDGACPTVGGSSISEGEAYIGNVSNFVEWINADHFKQNSNNIHFLYQDTGNTINFLQDTIWGGGPDGGFFNCDGTNDEAFYRVYDSNDNWGRSILKDTMSCGETNTSTGYIRAYKKTPLIEENPLTQTGLTECSVSGQSGKDHMTTVSQQLIFQGTAICNDLNPIDVIVTTNTAGAGSGETYVYCKGYGLCGWYQSLDFSENSPADWDESTDVCTLESAIESINRDPYYVEPIQGMYDYKGGGLDTETFDTIYEDLVAQGYQAYCSIPNIKYIASSNTNQTMLKDIMSTESGGNRVFVELDDYKQFFNYIDAQTPLWRKKGIYVLKDKDSLENFWSHKDETIRAGFTTADFSPAFTVTSPEDQCREKMKIMKAVDKKCSTLQNPETCALDIAYTPNQFKYWELFKEIKKTGFECSQMKTPNEELNQAEIRIKNSIMEMPFTLPTSYRYAFAIYSAELREPRIENELGSLWSGTSHKPGFDFLRSNPIIQGNSEQKPSEAGQNAKPRNEVRIIAFLVPDFATNQDTFDFTYLSPAEVNYPAKSFVVTPKVHKATYPAPDYDFNDALKIARNALQTPELQEDYATIWKARKEGTTLKPNPFTGEGKYRPFSRVSDDYYEELKGEEFDFDIDPNDENKKLIECLYWNEVAADPEYSCIEPMAMALTTFVNRRMENPEDCNQDAIDWEKNSTIFDDAGIERSDAGLLQLYDGEKVHALDDGLYPNGIANVIPSTDDKSLGALDDLKKKVFEFRFLSHYAFSSFYDGLDPVYRDQEPLEDENNKAVINGYLVYPQGYELEAAEDTILQAFLTPEQIEQFNQDFKDEGRDIWFKMDGIEQKLTEKTKKYGEKFMFRTEGECSSDYDDYIRKHSDGETAVFLKSYTDFREESCKKYPEAKIESESQIDKEPRLLGARFGYITIKLQQTLRKINTPTWDYVTSCLESDTPTEDFLTGRCSGIVKRDGLQDDTDDPDTDYMDKVVAECNGGPRVVNDSGSYSLPRSTYSCTIEDSINTDLGAGTCDESNPDNCASQYSDSDHGIENWLSSSDRVNCDKDFFSFVACSFNEKTAFKPSLIAHKVDSSGNFTEDGDKTACQYVQDRAAREEVSPRLALAVWLEKSGASAYSTETGGADFGVISAQNSRQSGGIEAQLRLFLGTINSNHNIGYPRFLLQYSGEYLYTGDPTLTWRDWEKGDPVLFCRNREFAGRLKSIYEQLGSYK